MENRLVTIPVWDPVVRIFHWSLALLFFVAYLTEDELEALHVWAGYGVVLLVGLRLTWGVVGTRYARFGQFVRSPRVVLVYLRQMGPLQPPHYLGHNPAAAAMVVTLLVSLILVSFTGMAIIAPEGQGPLADAFVAGWAGEWMEETHDFFATLTLALIVLHVGGVLFSSWLEGQNPPRTMITGRKRYRSDYADWDPPPPPS